MKCPSCNAAVADDAAICSNCDHILDPSLFDAKPPDGDGDPTGAKRIPSRPPPPKPGKKPLKKAKKRPPGAPAKGRAMPEAPAAGKRSEKQDWRAAVSKADWDAGAPPPSARQMSDANLRPLDPEDFLSDTKHFLVAELSIADKLAFFGSALMFVSCFFPWRVTAADGDVLGLLSLGVIVFGLAAIAMASVAVRVRQLLGKMNPVMPWVVQLAAISGAVGWCLISIRASWDSTMVAAQIGNEQVMVSKPGIGVVLALLAGAVAGLGTLFGLKGKT